MTMVKQTQKDKILKIATKLIARYGYHGVGVRKIAQEANVNVSMINYYFGSKIGILKEILDNTLEAMKVNFTKNVTMDDTFSQRIRKICRALVNLLRENTDAFLVFYTQLYIDHPEISELKAKRISEIINLIYGPTFLKMYKNPELSNFRMDIIGPTFLSVITSHFIFKPIISILAERKDFDEEFYETYINTISEFMIRGIGPEYANKKPQDILNIKEINNA